MTGTGATTGTDGFAGACAADAAPVVVIAIDGPTASGKGTIAQRVATALGFHYLDSGALYRVTALAALQAGVALDDEGGVAAVAAALPVAFPDGRIELAGQDVGDAIRTEQISQGASIVAAHPAVRAALLARQRAFRKPPGLVCDGRDMGSVVFPSARWKVYLDAAPEERARRRCQDFARQGRQVSEADVLAEILQRDRLDSTRAAAPLVRSAGALYLDSTGLPSETVLGRLLAFVRGEADGA